MTPTDDDDDNDIWNLNFALNHYLDLDPYQIQPWYKTSQYGFSCYTLVVINTYRVYNTYRLLDHVNVQVNLYNTFKCTYPCSYILFKPQHLIFYTAESKDIDQTQCTSQD